MTPLIHILDANSANQIAAGEVVERPASVVKELVENSLDAGAKHIDITIEGNGVPLIRVRDDGSGIGRADLPLAVIRHATSKITQIEDLDHLQTLGFRGEALPSIASVSHFEISSRPEYEEAGLSFTLKGGEEEGLTEIGCPVGTSVTVRDLFFNTPARLKFLKSTATEFGLISDTVGRIALAHPEIAISLTHPQQVVLQTTGRGDLREAIGAVIGYDLARQLIPIQMSDEKWRLEGFISPPNLVRSSKQAQFFMVNGRIIRSPLLSRALAEGYHTLIPAKHHPIAVLHVSLPPSEYDVNVHPTKMDVRFKDEAGLSQFIREAVNAALLRSKPLPAFQSQSQSQSKAQPSPVTKAPLPSFQVQKSSPPQNMQKLPDLQEQQGLQDLPRRAEVDMAVRESAPDNTARYEQPQIKFEPQPAVPRNFPAAANKSVLSRTIQQTDLPIPEVKSAVKVEDSVQSLSHMWPLTQLFNTYILATDGKILTIIDQHAAHERINYERLLREFKEADQPSQVLLIPIPMEFTVQEEQVLLENLWILNEMGFILEQFGSRTYLLRGIPVQTGNFPADELLRQFIEEVLIKNSPPTFDKMIEEWIYMLACKESIKARDSLNTHEMEQLIAALGRTHNPYTCPHGRPTMVTMTRSELEKRFYRT
ncbi:DNA mismatch repair protein MutL [Desulfosporosinus orientis DSM 765]|uniref:DNA mismatch repair protein MutL n=1 Tax=Desulfosporosinus orientis (strain ATCC 19365 / DSM 765 / NCIMB 8382 / VKM B-1628 / Singapore I) TaxID=768706 RepID=G7W968_DESOD|nr:DNA mismatch repair endonuclease MutL [Desulfosporosinus orientis]AET68709.1 DNA mismatch repair protein MutL [Desulfosporosinus orientis DSM 765]